MDLFKTLIELNNKIELQKISEEKYKYDGDEDEDEKQLIYELRKKFIDNYNKKNNRQFKLLKYKI